MTIAQTAEPTPQKPLRLWPGVAIVIVQWLVKFVLPVFVPDAVPIGMIGGVAGGLAILVWWLFFSRAPWPERLGAVGLMIAVMFAVSRFIDVSIATGAQGMLFPILAIPFLCLAFVVWAVASQRLSKGPRLGAMAAAILLGCGVLTLVRTAGITGAGGSELMWRWTKTPEERLIAQAGDEPVPAAAKIPEQPAAPQPVAKPAALPPPPAAARKDAEWPGFRGPNRDGVVRGVRIETDWSAAPPVQLWRRPIGPAWSSFAVSGDRLYTQEQRGDHEIVACYNVTTGKPVWTHRDAVRFWESNAGAGPRATPALSDGRVYTFGGTGILNALDADTGALLWSRDVASDTGVKVPTWGRSSSPLVAGGLVIVYSGSIVAYDRATGKRRWTGEAKGGSYSSPHLLTIGGVAQIVQLSGDGVTSVATADGTRLWAHAWPGAIFVQPAMTADGDVLISGTAMTGGSGTRRLAVAHGPAGWTVEERWTSIGLKPYFNDFVIHKGHAYGFDGNILASINLEDGKRKWKGGRYGNGQLVLLADQDLLLVLSEEGELALVAATPDQFTEIARIPAIEGKTWNHPALAGDVLLVRNGQEMVAFRLSRPRS